MKRPSDIRMLTAFYPALDASIQVNLIGRTDGPTKSSLENYRENISTTSTLVRFLERGRIYFFRMTSQGKSNPARLTG